MNTKATARLERLTCQSFNTEGFPAALARLPNYRQARHKSSNTAGLGCNTDLAGLQNCSSVRQSSNTARKMLRGEGQETHEATKTSKKSKIRKIKKSGSWERMPRPESGKVKNLEKIKKIKKIKALREIVTGSVHSVPGP